MFHLTHRCHNRAFLLKFAHDRNAYRARLREQLFQYDLWLLDYCLTSNHVHLLVDAQERWEVSGLMRAALARESVGREPCWTESLAVGSAGFVERIQPMILSRQEIEVVEAADGVRVLREAPARYGQETGTESDPKS